jgi:hypothetical protein
VTTSISVASENVPGPPAGDFGDGDAGFVVGLGTWPHSQQRSAADAMSAPHAAHWFTLAASGKISPNSWSPNCREFTGDGG